ncbi:serine/threonine protein kinase [Pontibacillus sp. HMF3514]|uniref:serine/threonine protein kinase n=1 Tax=Pontibacillus sp. HMF3514 TaxID=2692425 RepID=UPI00131FA346|nr:serine/threonine protein kinase [Pontibacillus sp. HMF3514]QHE51877.1 serine/threonine protein kinase [Pontibacillus sp. HMF3514]
MVDGWRMASHALSQINVTSNPNNEPVSIDGDHKDIRCVGVGTDAAVFQTIHAPLYAFKLYAKDKVYKIKEEERIYRMLGESPYFPKCFEADDRWLVLRYEEGVTLYDCILQGIHIPEQVIKDVEDARGYVREKGLNPRDIHLRNILLQDGRAKIIDVSEYAKSGNDYRWEHLMQAYHDHYHLIDRKAIPFWLVETVRKWYNQWSKHSSSFEDFMKMIMKFKARRD